jgi:hypothetical protein
MYLIRDTVTGAVVGGPYASRTTAQEAADELERRMPG